MRGEASGVELLLDSDCVRRLADTMVADKTLFSLRDRKGSVGLSWVGAGADNRVTRTSSVPSGRHPINVGGERGMNPGRQGMLSPSKSDTVIPTIANSAIICWLARLRLSLRAADEDINFDIQHRHFRL